jgi:6-phosphogluconolactonase (cycloisomerase 2 family)
MRTFLYGLLAAAFVIVCIGTARGAATPNAGDLPDTGSCTYTISPKSTTLSYKGGAVTVKVTAKGAASCPAPDISQDGDWIGLSPLTFNANKGTLKLTVPGYNSSILRTGTVSVGSNTLTVTQDGEPCSLALGASSSDLFPKNGGTGQFEVIATPADCAWTVAPSGSSSWVGVTSSKSGAGTGNVAYTVGPNGGKAVRNGTVAVQTVLNKKTKSYAVKQSNMLQGNAAFRAASVAGYQAVGAGGSFPLGALQIASPSGSPIHNAARLRAILRGAGGAGRVASQAAGTLGYVPEIDLYMAEPVLNGNVITMGFYSDSTGTQPAGTVTITLPPTFMGPSTDPTSYVSYPVLITIAINITGGNVPCNGNIRLTFTGPTGANSMTGTNTLTRNGVVFTVNLALDDKFNVTGSISVKESGATLEATDVQGTLFSGQALTCNVTVEPYGWTGTGTIDLFTGQMTVNLNSDTYTAASGALYNLDVNYADGTQEIVVNAPSAGLTVGMAATGGTPQTAQTYNAFGSPLAATIKDSNGNPVSGATVTFTAPAGSGASGLFDNGTRVDIVNTNASGVATTGTFTANADTGSYTVTASAPEVAYQVCFALTNFDVPAAVTATGGTPQSAMIDTAFGSPLVATVTDSDGNPVSGVTVTFTAPGSSASGVFAGGQTTAVTDSLGVATSAIFIANGTAGNYTVTATVQNVAAPADFALTNLTGSPSAATGYVYVANSWGDSDSMTAGTVSQYTIGPNGALTAMSPPSVAAGGEPSSIAADPSSKYVYVANSLDGTVSQYTIGPNGALAPMSPAPTVQAGYDPSSIAVHPSGKYAYVANSADRTISQYTVGSNGALAPMSPAPTIGVQDFMPTFIAVDPSGQYLYSLNYNSNNIVQYTIGTDGSLSFASLSTLQAGDGPTSIAFVSSGGSEYAYVTCYLGVDGYVGVTVAQYTVGTNGTLVSQGTVSTSANGLESITFDPSGKYAYVASNDGTPNPDSVSQFTVGPNGVLSPMDPATVSGGSGGMCVTVDPSGKYVYVANYYDGDVWQYTIGQNGALSYMTPYDVGAGFSPVSMIAVGLH